MAKADEFTAILMGLEGVTVLETPRVSRETIISTLRDHTLVLRDMKKGLASVTSIVTSLAAEAGDNRRILQNLQDDNKKMRTDIDKLYTLSDEFRKEMDEIGEKVADLYVLKTTVKEHKEFVDDLNARFGVQKKVTDDYQRENDSKFSILDKKADETIFNLKELKHYVEHFADNLILPSSQVTVEAAAGFATRPTPLLDIMKGLNMNNTDVSTNLKLHADKIKASEDKIETKADDSVLHDVKGLTRKVTAIENHILKEEEQGVGAIRRACEELSDKMQGITTEMSEKMDRREVSFIVHEKYEEIVKYLQDALQSSAEDENNFKQKADEIQALVMTLSNTKADRVEISPMQEILVKTEIMLKKLGGGNKKEHQYSKKEIESMLALKVDREEFEQSLSGMTKNKNSRSKKLAALAGHTNHMIIDEAMMSAGHGAPNLPNNHNNASAANEYKSNQMEHTHTQSHHMDHTGMGSVGGVNDINKDKDMWKNLSKSMKDEAEEAILRSAYKAHTMGGGNASEFSAFILSKKAQGSKKSNQSMSLPNHSQPGAFRQSTEQGISGGNFNLSRPHTADNSPPGNRPPSQGGYAAPAGHPGGPSELYPNVPVPPGQHQQQADHPFRPEGENAPDNMQDMSFLGAQVAGGGFNQRDGGGLKHAPMKSLMSSQPISTIEPVTGLGVMVKGINDQYYVTDDCHSPQHKAAKNAPTAYAKPVNIRSSTSHK